MSDTGLPLRASTLRCGKCKWGFSGKAELQQHLMDRHHVLPQRTKWQRHRLAKHDRKLLKFCYLHRDRHEHFSRPTTLPRRPILQNVPNNDDAARSLELADTWFAARPLFKSDDPPTVKVMAMDLDAKASSSILSLHFPDARPTLSLDTFWPTRNGQVICIKALVDTGCNTSLIRYDTLALVTDSSGAPFLPKAVPTATLTAASGNAIALNQSAHLAFRAGDTDVSHSFYLIDSLPIAEQLILGMDFLVKHQACIDVADNSIQLHSKLRCLLAADLQLRPGAVLCMALMADPHVDTAKCGYLQGADDLPSGCILWHGVQERHNGQVSAYISNQSEDDITLKAATQVAWWEPDVHGEIAMGDRLVEIAKHSPPKSAQNMTVSSLTISDNGDDWEWAGEHLYLDLARTPAGDPDPPVDASAEQLKESFKQTTQRLEAIDEKTQDACDERRRVIQQLDRINTRIKRYDDDSVTASTELPPDLQLETGYDHLTPTEKSMLRETLCSEAPFFMKGKYPKVIRTEQPVRIDVGKAVPRTSGFRRLNPEEQAVVNEYVEKLISADVVEACNGPWSSPILLVPKKDGGLRAVADLRKVNACVMADSYTMPDTHDLIDQLAGATWFTLLDLSSAFWQLPLAEESRDCTAFMTKTHGLLRWKAMPMGFKNSSAYFQREIDSALKGLRLSCCVVYIDDVCVYSSGSLEDHLEKVKAVLRALRVVGFSGNPAKCKFAQREVVFLGHRVADGKVYPLEDKVRAMVEYQRPTSLRELRGFLGLMSYYRKFSRDFASISAPLTDLTRHTRGDKSAKKLKDEANTPWEPGIWGEVHEKAFETLKGALLTRPVLVLPNPNHKWRIATDASNVAMGAVLSQVNDKGEEHPIGYYSRKVSGAQTRWSIWELELAAVVWAITTVCRHYLRSVPFELVTDSKVVAAIINKEVPKRRENLLVRLFEFNFTVTHRKGELNRNADFFSRWAAYKEFEEEKTLKACYSKIFVPDHPWFCTSDFGVLKCFAGVVDAPLPGVLDPLPDDPDNPDFTVLRQKLIEEQRKDPKLKLIIEKLEADELVRTSLENLHGHDDGAMDEQPDPDEQKAPPTARRSNPDSFVGLPLKVSDFAGEEDNAEAGLVSDEDATDEDDAKEEELPKAKRKAKTLPKRGNKYVFRLVGPDKLLVKACPFRSAKQDKAVVIWPIVVPDTMVPAIMGLFHGDKSLIGHGGKHKTYGAMRRRFTWKGMVQAIRQWIGACHKCLRRKRRAPEHQQYNVHPKAVAPMNRICVDVVGPFEQSLQKNTHILTIYDPFSHWPSAYPIKNQTAETVIECLKKHIALHSAPAECLSDRGKNFMAKAVKDFLEEMGTKKYETTPYKPSSNGSVERFHQYLSSAMYFASERKPDTWEDNLDMVLFSYRTTPIDGLDITPFEVIYGRKPNLPIDNLLFRENYDVPITNMEEYMSYMFDNQESMFKAVQRERKERFDRNKRGAGEHKKNKTYNIGDKVYLTFPPGRFTPIGGSKKLSPRNDGPYTVLEDLLDGLVYRVKHDVTGYITTTSVGRMMLVTKMVMPTNAVDLPLPEKWQQLTPQRADRINDVPEAKDNEDKQQALLEANDEANSKDALATKADEVKDKDALATKAGDDESRPSSSKSNAERAEMQDEPEEGFNLDDDYKFDSEVEEDADEQTKVKSNKRLAKAMEQPMAKKAKAKAREPATQHEQSAAVDADPQQERPKRERRPKQAQQSSEYEKFYKTGPNTRAERVRQRALRAGRDEDVNIGWLAIAPAANKQSPNSRSSQRRKQREKERTDRQSQFNQRGQVTPEGGKEPQVRLGTRSRQIQRRNRVGCAHCTTQQWEGLAEPYLLGDSFMTGAGVTHSAPRNSLQITHRT